MERSRRCNAPIPPRPPGTTRVYCGENCRKRAGEERDPDDRHDDVSILAVRKRLENATYSSERCRCTWPLAAMDEDDTWRCVKCARPLTPSIAVHELPPAAFRTTFAG